MSCIVKSHDKKSGITYVYRSESFWDPIKKRPSPRRTCIGHLDPDTGEIVPNGKRGRPKKNTIDVDRIEETVRQQKQVMELIEELAEAKEQLQKAKLRERELLARLEEQDKEKHRLEDKIDTFKRGDNAEKS